MAITLLTAKVKYPAQKVIETKHGNRINAVVELESGEDIKVWGNPGSAIAHLKKGQSVQLVYDGKSHKLVTDQPLTTADKLQSQSVSAELTPAQKRAWAKEIENSADLLKFCYQTVQSKFEGVVENPAEIRALAITLFIQATNER